MKQISMNTRLSEFLMTSFLVIAVYELISKPMFKFLFSEILVCEQGVVSNSNNHFMAVKFVLSQFSCIGDSLPKWLFSTFNGGNSTFLITVFSLIITGLLIRGVFKFSNFLYEHPSIKKFMQGSGRKEFYTDELGAKLLLTFMIFGFIILFLYPIFGILVLIKIINIILDKHRVQTEINE